jgi:hypothetical protein
LSLNRSAIALLHLAHISKVSTLLFFNVKSFLLKGSAATSTLFFVAVLSSKNCLGTLYSPQWGPNYNVYGTEVKINAL